VIRTAKALGYTVFTADNSPSNPGHALADKSFHVDTTDIDGILGLVEREQIEAVIAACTDVAVPTAARVGARFGLPAPPVVASDILCSKLAFRDFFASLDLPRPEHVRAPVPTDLFARHPAWIVKPDRSSGSKGVAIVHDARELEIRVAQAAALSSNREVIVEQFIAGAQGTCEGVVVDGRVTFHLALDRQTAAPPYTTTTGQLAPSRLASASVSRLIAAIERVIEALKISHCVFDCDFVCAGDEIYLLEISPRLGGNSITALVRAAYPGFDLVEYALRLACNDRLPPLPTQPPMGAAVRILGAPLDGTLTYDAGEVEALRAEPWVIQLVLDVPPGSAVRAFENSRYRLGEAVVVARDRDELDRRLAELDHRLRLAVA
jgi:biotin carboxylase